MRSSKLNTKGVLAVGMESTAGGPQYSGGLGELLGSNTSTMARLGASYVIVTPIYKHGYGQQFVTDDGVKNEYVEQNFEDNFVDTGIIVTVPIANREIKVKVWRHKIFDRYYGVDTFLPENGEFANITNILYGEYGFGIYDGEAQRLMQEVILGVSAVKLCDYIEDFKFDILHLNEGHGVFAALYILSMFKKCVKDFGLAWNMVKRMTVFTTHTPIAAGNKSRPIQMIMDMGANFGLSYDELKAIGGDDTGTQFGSTTAALRLSKIANAVALRHQFTSRELWQKVSNGCPITYINNGVDLEFWQDKAILSAYKDNSYERLLEVHKANKRILIDEVEKRNGIRLNENAIIVGFARRIIGYKRAELIFKDIAKFERLIKEHDFQIIFSGKTHPKDYGSYDILIHLYNMSKKYPNNVVFLQNYDVEICKLMTRGCDVWLANPQIPLEACSTSGMKAASNGVLNLSTLDGWWAASCRHGINGWSIGDNIFTSQYVDDEYLHQVFTNSVLPAFGNDHFWDTMKHSIDDKEFRSNFIRKFRSAVENGLYERMYSVDADNLYRVLEEEVLPAYYDEKAWTTMMMAAIRTALEHCSAERMCEQYYEFIYNAPYLNDF